MEIAALARSMAKVHECVDNDETAAQIALLVRSKRLVILTGVDGIYADPTNPQTLIEKISGKNDLELLEQIEGYKKYCEGASRKGANGAKAKLEYIKDAAANGTLVYIANAKYTLKDILSGQVPCTRIGIDI